MANVIETNELTSLVMLRFLEAAPYLMIGSKKHFSDQLTDKRNGQTYEFVIRDSGIVQKGLSRKGAEVITVNDTSSNAHQVKAISARDTIVEKRVRMTVEDWNIMVETNAIERFTDLNWEDEVAKPQGGKLAQGVTRDLVKENFARSATVVIGSGFQPLAEASAYLEEISSEKIFGFIDSKYQAILTANGQQFNPCGSPNEFYKTGLLGTFHEAEYHSQRFIPKIKVSTAVKTAIEAASAAVIKANPNWNIDPKLSTSKCPYVLELTVASGIYPVKAGTPLAVAGLFACDLLGDVTDAPFYFIVGEDVAPTAASTTLTLPIGNILYDSATKSGTRVFAKEDGEGFVGAIDAASAAGNVNNFIAASTGVKVPLEADKVYYCGQLRLDGAMEFETLNKFDASNAETKAGDVAGYMMFENRVVDLDQMTNDTRWDIVALAGIVDPRACINVYSIPTA